MIEAKVSLYKVLLLKLNMVYIPSAELSLYTYVFTIETKLSLYKPIEGNQTWNTYSPTIEASIDYKT